jgi:hypothetical protein
MVKQYKKQSIESTLNFNRQTFDSKKSKLVQKSYFQKFFEIDLLVVRKLGPVRWFY